MDATSLLLVLVIISGCVSDSPHQSIDNRATPVRLSVLPQLGEHFQPQASLVHLEMTASASLDPAYVAMLDGTNFVVAVSQEGFVRYIATTDVRFSTPEGIHVGSALFSVLAAGAANPIAETGWGFHTLLPSRWSVGFTNGAGLSEPPLPRDSRVVWIFQR